MSFMFLLRLLYVKLNHLKRKNYLYSTSSLHKSMRSMKKYSSLFVLYAILSHWWFLFTLLFVFVVWQRAESVLPEKKACVTGNCCLFTSFFHCKQTEWYQRLDVCASLFFCIQNYTNFFALLKKSRDKKGATNKKDNTFWSCFLFPEQLNSKWSWVTKNTWSFFGFARNMLAGIISLMNINREN